MTYLILIFVSPVYFIMRKKWGAFTLNLILYGLALLFLITFFFAWVAPFFWLLAVGHAGWHLRTEIMEEQAGVMARKLAEEMRRPAPGTEV